MEQPIEEACHCSLRQPTSCLSKTTSSTTIVVSPADCVLDKILGAKGGKPISRRVCHCSLQRATRPMPISTSKQVRLPVQSRQPACRR
jgi:hypothetical protein